MSCHYCRTLLEMAAMADLESKSMDTGCGGHLLCTFLKLVRTLRRGLRVRHTWPGVATPLEIGVHLGH